MENVLPVDDPRFESGWVAGQAAVLRAIATHTRIEIVLRQICDLVHESFPETISAIVVVDRGGNTELVGSGMLPTDLRRELLRSSTAELLRLDLSRSEPRSVELPQSTGGPERLRYWPLTAIDGRTLGAIAHFRYWGATETNAAFGPVAGAAAFFAQISLEKDLAAHQFSRLLSDERRLIAERMHDEPIQSITAASLMLQRLALDSDPESANEIRKVRERIDHAGQQMRRLLIELHPVLLEEVGLVAAIRSYLDGTFDIVDTEWEVDDQMDVEPDYATSILAFRLVHEALANVAKHASADRVIIRLRTADTLEIDVIDDGIGFRLDVDSPARAGHLGRPNIEALARRASGSIEHRSSLGEGCAVSIRLPLVVRNAGEATSSTAGRIS